MKKLPSFIQNSTDFINLIESKPYPTDCLLVSIDVSSLYTNIPHKEGIESILHFLTNKSLSYEHPEQPNPQIIAELVLKNNAFEFNEEFYIQKQGTAMGTKMAPAYANLFMGDTWNQTNWPKNYWMEKIHRRHFHCLDRNTNTTRRIHPKNQYNPPNNQIYIRSRSKRTNVPWPNTIQRRQIEINKHPRYNTH